MGKTHYTIENYLVGGKKSVLEPNLTSGVVVLHVGVGSADIQV